MGRVMNLQEQGAEHQEPAVPAKGRRGKAKARDKGRAVWDAESRQERFKRIINRRVPKILHELHVVRRMARLRNNYQWNLQDAAKFTEALRNAVAEVERAFVAEERQHIDSFRL